MGNKPLSYEPFYLGVFIDDIKSKFSLDFATMEPYSENWQKFFEDNPKPWNYEECVSTMEHLCQEALKEMKKVALVTVWSYLYVLTKPLIFY